MSRTRIVKGKYTIIVGGNYNMYSASDIITTAAGQITETSGEGIFYGDNPEHPPVAEIDILADAVVHFRPMRNWKGKDYGMDWMRIDDTGLFGDDKYIELVGTYDKYPSSDPSAVFTTSASLYNGLKREYSNPVYKVPWLKKDDKPIDYFATWLCVEKNKEVSLSLKVHIKDKNNLPKEFVVEYDKTICEITTSKGKGAENITLDPTKAKHYAKIGIKKDKDYKLTDELKIKVIAEIERAQTIKVLCDGKDAGFLKLYNNKKKKLNIVCVSVKTSSGTGNIKGKTELENSLKQSLIKVNIADEFLDTTINSDMTPNNDLQLPTIKDGGDINISGNIRGKSLYDYIDEKLKNEFPNLGSDGKSDGTGKYDKYLHIYFFKEKAYLQNGSSRLPVGGIGTPIGNGRCSIFDGIETIDVTHETLHAIALGHSFGKQDNISTTTPYLFAYKKTENMMDYAHLDGKDKYSIWKWQWDKLRNFNLLEDE